MKVRVLTWHDQWRWVRQQYSWIKRYEERMYRSAGCPWYIRCICCWNFVYHQFWNMKRAHLLWYHVSPNYSWYTTAMYISTPFKVWCPKQQCKTMHSIGKRLGEKKKKLLKARNNKRLQVYPFHYLSKTGAICFWPIAWFVGCVFNLIPSCTRFWLQMDRIHLFLVVALNINTDKHGSCEIHIRKLSSLPAAC